MKRLLLLALGLFACVQLTFAQKTVEAVHLKNGNVIYGTIIEQIPGQRVRIQTSDGSIFTYTAEEINRITREKAPQQQHEIVYLDRSYPLLAAHAELGITGFGKDMRLELLPSVGAYVNRHIYLGAGIGLNFSTWKYAPDSKSFWLLPIYAHGRGILPLGTKYFTPFADLKLGYSAGLTNSQLSGLYFSAALGVAVTKYTFSVGYGSQSVKIGTLNNATTTANMGGLSIKLGMTF
jgi:hypothetical protein